MFFNKIKSAALNKYEPVLFFGHNKKISGFELVSQMVLGLPQDKHTTCSKLCVRYFWTERI